MLNLNCNFVHGLFDIRLRRMLQLKGFSHSVAVSNIRLLTIRLEYAQRHIFASGLSAQLIRRQLAKSSRYCAVNSSANGNEQSCRPGAFHRILQKVDAFAYFRLRINDWLNAKTLYNLRL
ncbi:hypothetical protein D3C78_1622260 [compost metagenome]